MSEYRIYIGVMKAVTTMGPLIGHGYVLLEKLATSPKITVQHSAGFGNGTDVSFNALQLK